MAAPPVLLAVDDDPTGLCDVERELHDRYGRHYTVVCLRSPIEAREQLEAFAADGHDVALVLAAQWLSGMTGSDFLTEVRRLHPRSMRGLLISYGDWGQKASGEAIFEGISHGRFDHYVLRPAESPDELFHQTMSGLLLDWAESQRAAPYTVHIVGETWSGRAHELREVLQQCAIAHHFCLADSTEGRQLVERAGEAPQLPLIVFPNGQVLQDPTNLEIAEAAGSPTPANLEQVELDVVIVGAGPAGLSAAVYGASEGFGTLVVDQGGVGGQATSSSLIRNYLGFPRGISGRRLAQGAYNQAWVFGADFAFMQKVTGIERDGDHVVLTLSEGGTIRAGAVLLTMGASYRRIGVPELEALTGAGVYYGSSTSEASSMTGGDAYIVGGANSAGQAALHLSRYAKRVTLVVRAGSLRAGMSEYLVRQIEATDNIDVLARTEVVGGGGEGRLEHLVLEDRDSGERSTVDAHGLFLLIGAQPCTEWLPDAVERDQQGFILTGQDVPDDGAWPLERRPLLLETSMPGVFAAGDVRHGAVKRVASAVGEGSIAIQLLHQYFADRGMQPHGRPAYSPDPTPAPDVRAGRVAADPVA
ncbi:FAD-dependent oxidoreductase [Dermatobacter hominis]|uniref:FAD-dependent oxidoreductase n=1 Tax=Dermatobacter hominis TaxID=2884263 RepID=UPI001D12E22B|nr:FAD-dependent oxidoreductase [Dermatobacter hominis]UDY35161.1 FAD-dependent oxidoreductase [Dermatobacter hominis]